MSKVCLLKYNNYYNKIAKKLDTYADYDPYVVATYTNLNFYKKDDTDANLILNTSLLSNGPTQTDAVKIDDTDYVLELDPTDNEILSRWFIITWQWVRGGQWRAILRRDVNADCYDEILDADCYIEKATCGDNDIAIYNQEAISFNSIKRGEYLLKDASKRAWIVGYYHEPDTNKTIKSEKANFKPDFTFANQTAFFNSIGYTNNYKRYKNQIIYMIVELKPAFIVNNRATLHITNNTASVFSDNNTVPCRLGLVGVPTGNARLPYVQNAVHVLNNYKNYIFGSYLTNNADFSSYHNKTVRLTDGTTKTYKIIVTATEGHQNKTLLDKNSTSYSNVKQYLTSNGFANEESLNESTQLYFEGDYTQYSISLVEISYSNDALSYTIDKEQAKTLIDAPYKMFAIPYSDEERGYYDSSDNLQSHFDKLDALNLAVATAKGLGTFLIDIQLLPYLPNQEIIVNNKPSLHGLAVNKDFALVEKDNNTVGFVLFPTISNFTLDISQTITCPETALEKKIVNQCDTYRLCSPNYSAGFEFNPVKTGTITKFNVDCTYKPVMPYIHINPNWSKLYGADFDDTRGLIVQGDFSLPIINDSWVQYQINNKNYLNAFNRQIESIELRNKYAKVSDIAGAISGVGMGAVLGANIAGPIGAAVGAATSGVAGVADIVINEKLRSDALDLTKDQFNYSLENIKALPNTLAKISAFDINNKVFPILEFYSCTEEEKEIFRNKLKYNGMTIMRIDKIRNFLTGTEQYIKAKLVRINIESDTHLVNAIANELNEGVYFK